MTLRPMATKVPEPSGYPAPGWHYTNQHGFVYQVRMLSSPER
jgi:hypothetical protein